MVVFIQANALNSKCKIIFLRKNKNIDKPLVTLELRHGDIVQAKGKSNRSLTNAEREFLKIYTKENDLVSERFRV